MRLFIAALLVAGGVGLAGIADGVAAPAAGDIRAGGLPQTMVELAQWGGDYCARLRRACIYKEERGEWGYGNCRRYREECTRRESYCERLRRACEFKEERGETGYGNCRRYREECGYRRRDW